MSEQQKIEPQSNGAMDREEIAARVANFKATQEKFRQEREEYYVATLKGACRAPDRRSFSSRAAP